MGLRHDFDALPPLFDPPASVPFLRLPGDHGFPSLVDLNLLMNDPHHLLATCSKTLQGQGRILERRKGTGGGSC